MRHSANVWYLHHPGFHAQASSEPCKTLQIEECDCSLPQRWQLIALQLQFLRLLWKLLLSWHVNLACQPQTWQWQAWQTHAHACHPYCQCLNCCCCCCCCCAARLCLLVAEEPHMTQLQLAYTVTVSLHSSFHSDLSLW